MKFQVKHALWLALAFSVAAASVASSESVNRAAMHRLLIDPRTFVEMPAEPLLESAPRGLQMESRVATLGPRGDSLPSGPRITLSQPDDGSVFSADRPVSVHVGFFPAADGTEPDMTTLNVRVQQKTWLGWLGKDITRRVLPFVEDTAIKVPEIDFSGYTGDFQFRVSIRDFRDRQSEERFSVKIEGT